MNIHYNVTGERRKAMVGVIEETTCMKAVYRFMPTCTYEIGCYTVTRDGTLEVSSGSDIKEVETVLEALRTAGFEDIGGITEDAKEAKETLTEDCTTSQGDEANDEAPEKKEKHDTVELTVTLPMTRHTGMSLRNLINLIYTREGLLNKALGTAFRVDEGLVQVLQDNANVLSIECLFETVEAYENRHGNAAEGLTIEPDKLTFSTLPETDDPDVLRTFTALCSMMNRQALTQQRIQARAIREPNEKYAMRIWLLRLGMGGPEYKAERKILMRSLNGDGAFRTDDVKRRWQQKRSEQQEADNETAES